MRPITTSMATPVALFVVVVSAAATFGLVGIVLGVSGGRGCADVTSHGGPAGVAGGPAQTGAARGGAACGVEFLERVTSGAGVGPETAAGAVLRTDGRQPRWGAPLSPVPRTGPAAEPMASARPSGSETSGPGGSMVMLIAALAVAAAAAGGAAATIAGARETAPRRADHPDTAIDFAGLVGSA